MNRFLFGSVLSLALASTALGADQSLDQAVNEARLESQINTTYVFNRHLDAYRIDVDVEGDTAILTGTVNDAVEKDLAERIALNVEGIAKVDNRIAVDAAFAAPDRGADTTRDFGEAVEDASITAAVKSRLLWNDGTDGLDIDVDTMNGVVSLSGTANTPDEMSLAVRLAQTTRGVHRVDDRLVISAQGMTEQAAADAEKAVESAGETISDGWITAKVKSSLLMAKDVDGLDITVDTRDGVVTLGGGASSPAERDLAVAIAQGIRGVKRVDAAAVNVGS